MGSPKYETCNDMQEIEVNYDTAVKFKDFYRFRK